MGCGASAFSRFRRHPDPSSELHWAIAKFICNHKLGGQVDGDGQAYQAISDLDCDDDKLCSNALILVNASLFLDDNHCPDLINRVAKLRILRRDTENLSKDFFTAAWKRYLGTLASYVDKPWLFMGDRAGLIKHVERLLAAIPTGMLRARKQAQRDDCDWAEPLSILMGAYVLIQGSLLLDDDRHATRHLPIAPWCFTLNWKECSVSCGSAPIRVCIRR